MEQKVIAVNRQARHDYFIEESYEAGIVLDGGEVKSLRQGNISFADSFCLITKDMDVILKNAHIKSYEKKDGFNNSDSRRDRKLLLHKAEVQKLFKKVSQKNYTLVPLKFYFKQALIKVEVGLCKGKHTYDKKQTLVEQAIKRKAEREIKEWR